MEARIQLAKSLVWQAELAAIQPATALPPPKRIATEEATRVTSRWLVR